MAKQQLSFLSEFKKVDETLKFFKFEKENAYLHGIFLGTKEITSSLRNEKQTVWIVRVLEDYFEQDIFANDIVYVAEKSAMIQKRMMLREEQEFVLVYKGEKKSRTGRKYKEFELYVK